MRSEIQQVACGYSPLTYQTEHTRFIYIVRTLRLDGERMAQISTAYFSNTSSVLSQHKTCFSDLLCCNQNRNNIIRKSKHIATEYASHPLDIDSK